MPQIVYELEAVTAQFDSAMGSSASALAAVNAAAIGTAKAIDALLDSTFGKVDQINTWAQATGLSARTIDALGKAARAANKDVDALIAKDFSKRMLEAARGSGEAANGLKTLGISSQELVPKLNDTNALFRELLGTTLSIEDPLVKAATAEHLFGEAGKEMLSAFDSAEGFDRFFAASERWGIDVGPEAVKQSNAWWAATAALDVALEEVADTITKQVAPGATQFIEGLAIGIIGIRNMFKEVINEIGDAFTDLGKALNVFLHGPRGLADFAKLLEDGFDNPAEALDRLNAAVGRAKGQAGLFWADMVSGAFEATGAAADFNAEITVTERKVSKFLMDVIKLSEQMRKEAERDAVKFMEGIVRDAERSMGQLERVADAATAAGERMATEADEFAKTQKQATLGVLEESLVAWNDYFTKLAELNLENKVMNQQALLDREKQILAELQAEEDADKQKIQNQKDRIETVKESANAEVQSAFKQSQQWALGQVAANAAVAYIGMVAQLAPFLGPGAPIAAGAALGPVVAMQVAEIKSNKAPEVRHGGGVDRARPLAPDEVSFAGFRGLSGEAIAVLNRQAVANGAMARVNAENQLRQPAGGGGPTQLVLTDSSRRALAVAVLQEAGTPGSPAFQATTNGQPRGYMNPYRSRSNG